MATADKVFVNGKIYCIEPRNKCVEAVAIKDGKYLAVGTEKEMEDFVSSVTEVVDLEGKTVLPGFHDMHTHAINGAYKQIFECSLPEGQGITLDLILNVIREYVKDHPDFKWITGGNWPFHLLSQLHKELLDQIDSTRPIILIDFSTHNAWVNSKTLEIAGIDSTTPDPEGGQIIKDDQGEPTGVLLENALNLIQPHIPERKKEDIYKAGEWLSEYLNSFGITAIKDPAVYEELLDVYVSLAKRNKLHFRLATHLLWKCDYGNAIPYEQQIELVYNRDKYKHDRINTNYAKMFLDGVPAFKTGAFLEPYAGDKKENYDWKKMLLVDPEELKEDLVKLDKEGVTVKMHATGDAAVRIGLDAIQAAREQNGYSGLLHEIAHNGWVHREDIVRFKKLHAVAEFSPMFWYPSVFHKQKETILGKERADRTYPIRSIQQTGANVVRGSDWPIVPTPDPWVALETMVTRQNPYIDSSEILNPDEKLKLEEAIELFTINAAKTMSLEHVAGSIETGKFADMIVIDRDLFNISSKDISNVKVLETLVEGEVVYESKGEKSLEA
ncbi:amidohydrolase [Alteribacillus bidgolensis]|uniref:Amidohydrolase 3 domain-containing protein n=1 Tax=Alteribacillus bidgolensis TaxID=930129 RepID=A0A1G8QUU1_9BACI|nr:amidohydrolase [Alteribacillus bidgolensis]SDJ08476.1 hypothetical protein SAMN05216352_12223 [Alteribacillus bidgolensis]